MDLPGEYTMHVALDDAPKAALTLQVRAAEQAMMPAMTGLLS
jgi:hypothetical protein